MVTGDPVTIDFQLDKKQLAVIYNEMLKINFFNYRSTLSFCGWALSVLMIVAGRKLRRRAAHTFCIVIAAIECIFMPFGTVLGIFTLIVLTKESVKKLFEEKNVCYPPGAGQPTTNN